MGRLLRSPGAYASVKLSTLYLRQCPFSCGSRLGVSPTLLLPPRDIGVGVIEFGFLSLTSILTTRSPFA
jgi:hypothetical protein